jgi:hypothetical protein
MRPIWRTDVRALVLALALAGLPAVAPAQGPEGQSWTARKCDLYQRAVEDRLDILGTEGLRADFLARNDAFIAGGCLTQGDVCPETEAEIAFANLLTVMTMNEGMASTFVPFGCRD